MFGGDCFGFWFGLGSGGGIVKVEIVGIGGCFGVSGVRGWWFGSWWLVLCCSGWCWIGLFLGVGWSAELSYACSCSGSECDAVDSGEG